MTVQIVAYRFYPQGTLAAHVLGYVGRVSGPEEAKKNPGYEDNDTIGRAGVEATYDKYLHGTAREERVAIDPAGRGRRGSGAGEGRASRATTCSSRSTPRSRRSRRSRSRRASSSRRP